MLGVTGVSRPSATLLGSPLTGALSLMEASGLGGPVLGVVLLPGLLAAGIGSLIFIGLDSLTGLGTSRWRCPAYRASADPPGPRSGWAIVIGLAAALIGPALRGWPWCWSPSAGRWPMLVVPLAGVAVAVLAIIYAEATGKATSDVLFSGENALDPLITDAASYSVGALVLLMVCKELGHAVSTLSSFRGGPRFRHVHRRGRGPGPVHLPGLPPIAGRRDGHRRDERGDADPAHHLGAARHAAAGLRRPGPHAPGRRGGSRRLRRRRPPHTAPAAQPNRNGPAGRYHAGTAAQI